MLCTLQGPQRKNNHADSSYGPRSAQSTPTDPVPQRKKSAPNYNYKHASHLIAACNVPNKRVHSILQSKLNKRLGNVELKLTNTRLHYSIRSSVAGDGLRVEDNSHLLKAQPDECTLVGCEMHHALVLKCQWLIQSKTALCKTVNINHSTQTGETVRDP